MRCRKRRYRDRLSALIALSGAARNKDQLREKSEIRAYKCPYCKGWHLTSMVRADAS